MTRQCFERNPSAPCIRLESDDFLDNKRGRVWRIDGAMNSLGIERWDIITIQTAKNGNFIDIEMNVRSGEGKFRFSVMLSSVGGNSYFLIGRRGSLIFLVFALWDRTDGTNVRRGIHIEVFKSGGTHEDSIPGDGRWPEHISCPAAPIPISFGSGTGMISREKLQDNEGNGYEDPP